MKLSSILTPSFRALGQELHLHVEICGGRLVVLSPMWRKALSTDSQFCRAAVANGYLTDAQMQRAARHYRLGATRQGGVIFWQIDAEGNTYDGKVMYYADDCHRSHQHHPTWVSTLLARRYRWPDRDRMTTRHCFFGLHLLAAPNPLSHQIREMSAIRGQENNPLSRRVCIVESEKSAVILSAHFPGPVWLATGGLGNVQPDKFRPLRGRRVILFPDTDVDGKTYTTWYQAAQQVMQQPFWESSPPITVSPLLELHATREQKQRKIDLVDFLLESNENAAFKRPLFSLHSPRMQPPNDTKGNVKM